MLWVKRPASRVAATGIRRSSATDATNGSTSHTARSATSPTRDLVPPARGGRECRLPRNRLLAVPGLAAVPRAADGGGHRHPRVERGHRRIGAERQFDAGVEQAREHERPVGAAGPVAVGDVAVVHGVLGLDAGDDAEPGEPRDVRLGEQLGVLDAASAAAPPTDAELFEGVEGEAVGVVADGVHRRAEPRLGRGAP